MFASKSYLSPVTLLFMASAVATVSAQLTVSFCTEETFGGVCTPFAVEDSSCILPGAVGTDVSSVLLSEDLLNPSACRICESVSPCFYFYRAPVFTYPTYLSLRGDACDGPCIRIQSSQPTLGDNVENNINSFFCTLPA